MFSDAAYEPDLKEGGIGAAIFNESCECVGWFGFPLQSSVCQLFGSDVKQTIIYELELAASILALDFWSDKMKDGLQICFGDNDSARFSLIKGACLSSHASALMRYHLEREASNNLCTWYARVPTEANVSDYPSRNASHPLLPPCMDESSAAVAWFNNLQNFLTAATQSWWGKPVCAAPVENRVHCFEFTCFNVANCKLDDEADFSLRIVSQCS